MSAMTEELGRGSRVLIDDLNAFEPRSQIVKSYIMRINAVELLNPKPWIVNHGASGRLPIGYKLD